ncbi:conserved oligomeric Golgi complex subunit 6-like [Xenia sp. Carnegie-2017]|uniref:conserved oligomeric Golgi complex subunit 6-like n=1 Tax=Xenia sp. Carnegie-2017 TaxID=2897299 RepID=UPI001F04EE32|nr:conserved oligomeric Golgi complex subunit 6-like [Xenia sp. Carnegie-2017]
MADDTSIQANNPLSRKLNKILDMRFDNDKDLVEALKALSTFFTDNNLRERRNLRGDIEKRSLYVNEQFESAFRDVKQQLDLVHHDIQSMSECCEEMTTRLKMAREQTSDLISKTTKLQSESQKVQMKQKVANAFLDRFQLKQHEVEVLKNTRNEAITAEFFSALSRVKIIHNDCKLLLRTKQQTAGLEIMESMALYMESAYERLYRWAQAECRGLTGDIPEILSNLQNAMAVLQDRPVLLKYAVDEYAGARRTAIVRCFIDALTRGGQGGTPRPIELSAHDPIRYLGDMLAWLHQGFASEKESIQSLLKQAPTSMTSDLYWQLLGHISEGVCRPLKVRVEQVVVSEQGSVVLFKLTSVLKFYKSTISTIVGEESSFIFTIEELHTLTMKMFLNSLSLHASKVLDKIEVPPSDLGPTASLGETLVLLRNVLSSHDASVVPLDARRGDYSKVISSLIDPLLQSCTMSASRLGTCDMAAYMINCIYQIQSTLAVYEFTDKHIEMLAAQTEAHQDTLVSEQASFILEKSGIGNIYNIIQEQSSVKVPLSSMKGMDAQTIKDCMSKFDKYLSSPDSLVLPQVDLLRSTRLRDTVNKHTSDLVCVAYRKIYDAVLNPFNQYADPKTIVVRTPDQVKNLLA